MEERGRAIVLIGFMGTGKSSVGRALARRTNLPRFDTDELVTKRVGMSIGDIFERRGEEAFRDAEADAIAALRPKPSIVVTGGGALLRDGHIEKVRRLGRVVHLSAEFDVLMKRLSRRSSRPLLQTADPRATVADLLRVREPLYRAAADFVVDTSRLTHEEVVDAVLSAVDWNERDRT